VQRQWFTRRVRPSEVRLYVRKRSSIYERVGRLRSGRWTIWVRRVLLYQPLLEALNARNRGKLNNAQDALIGVTAIARGLTLVTDDSDLAAAVAERGGQVMSFHKFVAPDGEAINETAQ